MNTMERLDRYFRGLEAQEAFSGVVLITRGGEELYAEAYGYASRAWKIRNTLDVRFDTASVTKLFTSIATLQMVDRGDLTLDTQAVNFLGLHDTAISPDVSVFHLLTHSSGIGDDCEEEDGEIYEDLWRTKPNYSVTATADFLPQFVYKSANFAPGQGCRYCNCSWILLGLMIEQVTGISYRDYVRENVFAKAGMEQSDFLRLDRVHEDVAEGADPIWDDSDKLVGWKRNIYSFPPVGSPDSGAYVTARDLDRFLRTVQAGDLLSPELTEAFLTPQVHYRQRDDWTLKMGYGLMFYVDASRRVVCYQKEGVNAGVSSVLRHFPQRDINVVILSNLENGVWDPVWRVHELVMKGAFEPRCGIGG